MSLEKLFSFYEGEEFDISEFKRKNLAAGDFLNSFSGLVEPEY
jgi:hypothetical protein